MDKFSIPAGTTNSITKKDIERAHIRITVNNKQFFPQHDASLTIIINGEKHKVRFENRDGPDKKRSHLLHFGGNLMRAAGIRANGSFSMTRLSSDTYAIGDIPINLSSEMPEETPKKTAIKGKNTSQAVSSNESLLKGFVFIGILGDLLKNGLPANNALTKNGVYSITCPEDYKPLYVDYSQAQEQGNVIKPWGKYALASKWVEKATILYFGLAGRTNPRSLAIRLSELLKHGNGNITKSGPHKGGEILWQLKGYETFFLWIKSTPDPPAPRDNELELLERFNDKHSALPFANKQF